MSTLRVSNIEAKAFPSSPTVDEKVKVTNSSGDILLHLDGTTSGIGSIGIGTTGTTFRVDSNNTVTFPGNVTSSGIITASSFSGTVASSNLSGALPAIDGSALTGIDASSIKSGGAVKAQANSHGVVITGVATATSFKGDGANLTNLPDQSFDDNAILNDISSLALKVNALENLTAYNTESTFIDTYQDSTAVTALTNVERDGNEHMKSSVLSATAFNFKTAGTHGQPAMFGLNSWNVNSTSTHGHGWANDRVIRNNNNSSKYGGAGPKFAFDLRYDFECYQRADTDSSGNVHNAEYQGFTMIISKKTTADGYTLGKNPQLNGANILQAMGHSSSGAGLHGSNTKAELISKVFSSAAGTNMDINNLSESYSLGDANTSLNASTWHASGGLVRHYYNSGNRSAPYGVAVKFDRSANQMEIGFLTNGTGATFMSTGKTTITNVPAEGFLIFIAGDASGNANSRYYSLSVNNSSSLVGNGSIGAMVTSATGSYTSTTITSTAAADISKMGAVVTYTDQSGTTTLNTDLKLYLSANNGTNWTQGTLVTQPNFQTGIKMAKVNDVTISNAGKQLKYKIEWANQAAGSKVAVVNGVALQY